MVVTRFLAALLLLIPLRAADVPGGWPSGGPVGLPRLSTDEPGPATAVSRTTAARIPLVAGLTVVTTVDTGAMAGSHSVKQVTSVNPDGIVLSYGFSAPGTGAAVAGSRAAAVRGRRTIARADLLTARDYMQLFGPYVPERIPGSTALGVSTAVLIDLDTRGESYLTMRSGGAGTALGGLVELLAADTGEPASADFDKVGGVVRRVGPRSVPLRVRVNGVPTILRTVHAKGRLGDFEAELHLLDDPDNPLALRWRLGDSRLEVVSITFPEAAAGGL